MNLKAEIAQELRTLAAGVESTVSGGKVDVDSELAEINQATTRLLKLFHDQDRLAYLAGALFAGQPDEDAEIILRAYDEWAKDR